MSTAGQQLIAEAEALFAAYATLEDADVSCWADERRAYIEQQGYALLEGLVEEVQRLQGALRHLRTALQLNKQDVRPGAYHYMLDILEQAGLQEEVDA